MSKRTALDSTEFARKEMKRYSLKQRTPAKLFYTPLILKNILDGNTVIDVGCGTASRIIELVKNKEVYSIGVDIDKHSLNVAKAYVKKDSRGMIELVVADANSLPFRKNSMDVAIFDAALHHLPYTWKEVLMETYRLLKKHGKLILREPCSMNPVYNVGVRILRSKFGLFLTGSKDKQYLARYDEGEIAFKPDELIKQLEKIGFKVEKEQFKDFITKPVRRAAVKSRQPLRLALKLLVYSAKPLDYIVERVPSIQKYCSHITVICKKLNL